MALIPPKIPKNLNDLQAGSLLLDTDRNSPLFYIDGMLRAGNLPEGWVNVKDFGAKGDGVTDDTQAIQNAFNFAINNNKKVYIPAGTYIISQTLYADKTGFTILGDNESTTIIKATDTFTGTYLLDMGNDTISRYSNTIKGIFFDGNNIPNIIGVRWHRINNKGRIEKCRFENFYIAIQFDTLALDNTITDNRFAKNTYNIKIISTAGNGTVITTNYFNGGGIWLNEAMNGIFINNNSFDSNAYIYTDGTTAIRNCIISNNRFETTLTTNPSLDIGFVQRLIITNNAFTGNGITNYAINLRSSFSENIIIENNTFEKYVQSYINSASVTIYVFNNHDDNSVSTPISGTPTIFSFKGTTTEDYIRLQKGLLNRTSLTKQISQIFETTSFTAFDTMESKIQIDLPSATKGGMNIIIEGAIEFIPTSTAVSIKSFKMTANVISDSNGLLYVGTPTFIYKNTSLSTASTTRDITDITAQLTKISDTQFTIDFAISGTGTIVDLKLIGNLTIQSYYYNEPIISIL